MEDNVPAGVGIADVVDDTTPQLGGTLDSNAHQVSWSKGSDVASANALVLGTDGNYFDITGTTTITSIATLGIGTVVVLHFDGILTLTHQATDLILPGGANITTAAGDEAMFVEYASGDWRCVAYTKASGVAVVAGDYKPGGTDVAIADGGSGQSTAQAAIDALSQVSGATDEHVFTKDTGTGNAKWKAATGAPGSKASIWLGAEGAYLPQSDFSLAGTVTMTNGSTAVTGSGTAFNTALQVGDYIKLDADTSASWAKVASIETATGLTLTANYTGTGGASAGSGSGNPAELSESLGSGRFMGHSVVKFDDSLMNPDGGEKCGWRVPMPNYDGGNITVTSFSSPATTPAGGVTLQYNIFTIGLANSEAFDTALPVDTGVNISHALNTTELSTDICVASATIDPANVAAGDLMVLELARDVASDDLVGDGQLVGILIEYTRS